MKLVDATTEGGRTTLDKLEPGTVFKFVDTNENGDMFHLLIDGRIVELESPYNNYAATGFYDDGVVVYNAELRVSL